MTVKATKQVVSHRAVQLAFVIIMTMFTGHNSFTPRPHLKPAVGRSLRDALQALPTRIERTASYTLGDSSSSGSSSGSSNGGGGRSVAPAKLVTKVGWTGTPKPAATGRAGSSTGTRADFSKLFATPEPEGSPLAGLSRSCAGSCGSLPIFFAMSILVSTTFAAPLLGAQTIGAWLVGRLVYWRSMGDADVSRRLPAGFVGYMSLFLVVGGLAFMNSLKAIAMLKVV